jgi:hypothetical protein
MLKSNWFAMVLPYEFLLPYYRFSFGLDPVYTTYRIDIVWIDTITSLVLCCFHSGEVNALDVLDTSRSGQVKPPSIPSILLVIGSATDTSFSVSRSLALSAITFGVEEKLVIPARKSV